MFNNLYLIAHSVRGQPALDIAERCEDMDTPSDPGPWWIIPTSGHRAYPYWTRKLSEVFIEVGIGYTYDMAPLTNPYVVDAMPDDALDHYWHDGNDEIQARLTKSEAALAGRSLAEKLGLTKPEAPMVRRA